MTIGPRGPELPPTAMAERLCAWTGDTDEPICPRPGTWHFRWTPEVLSSFACDEHAARGRAAILLDPTCGDGHPIVADCGVPGCRWIYSDREPPGRCRWDPTIIEEPAVAARELVGAGSA